MANPEHMAILKQGFKVWNDWRKNNPTVEPYLKDANLSDVNLTNINLKNANLTHANLGFADLRDSNLTNANLSDANLNRTNLTNTNLTNADFSDANLNVANFTNVDLSHAHFTRASLISTNLSNANLNSADFRFANLSLANLSGSNLSDANLSGSNLNKTDLSGANFSGADLRGANFSEVNLSDANLQNSVCSWTIFANVDLSTVKGLDSVWHYNHTVLSIDTIFRSKGKIPEKFLRGCGVPETLITFLPSMMEEAIQFYSCFISYSHADKAFAQRLHDRLQGVGIRCWLDEHQLNVGDKLQPTIYDAIRVYDKVILCCSETSLKSWWVEKEFEHVIAKEEDFNEPLLIPVALDNYLFEQSADKWFIGEIRKKRLVQSFENWKDHDAFEAAFAKVVKALRTDGGKPPPPAPKLTPRK